MAYHTESLGHRKKIEKEKKNSKFWLQVDHKNALHTKTHTNNSTRFHLKLDLPVEKHGQCFENQLKTSKYQTEIRRVYTSVQDAIIFLCMSL